MLAAAEADFQQQPRRPGGKGGEGIGRVRGGKAAARQGVLQQPALAGAELVPALPPVEPGVRLQREKRRRSSSARSVRSQVKSSAASSGVRPKCP